MTVAIDGGPVVAHAQAFADEINRRWGFTHLLTYPGHQPDQQHALDSFHTRDVMLQLAEWCTHDDVIDQYGIDYVIFDVYQVSNAGEIYNREIARYWRTMEDRGSPTQNHHDHVHVSFNPTAAGPFGPGPAPTPSQEEDDMANKESVLLPYGGGGQCTVSLDNLKSGAAGWKSGVVLIPWDYVGGPRTHAVRIVAWDQEGRVAPVVNGTNDILVLGAAKTAVIVVKPEWSAVSITSQVKDRDPKGDTNVSVVLWR